MAEMPRRETSPRKRVWDYALGMIYETAWILAMTLFAYLMAVVAMAVVR
jgi:hypothetical protein